MPLAHWILFSCSLFLPEKRALLESLLSDVTQLTPVSAIFSNLLQAIGSVPKYQTLLKSLWRKQG